MAHARSSLSPSLVRRAKVFTAKGNNEKNLKSGALLESKRCSAKLKFLMTLAKALPQGMSS